MELDGVEYVCWCEIVLYENLFIGMQYSFELVFEIRLNYLIM